MREGEHDSSKTGQVRGVGVDRHRHAIEESKASAPDGRSRTQPRLREEGRSAAVGGERVQRSRQGQQDARAGECVATS